MRRVVLALLSLLVVLSVVWLLRSRGEHGAAATRRSEPRAEVESSSTLVAPIEEHQTRRRPIEPEPVAPRGDSPLASVVPEGVRLLVRLVDVDGRPRPNSSYLLVPLDPNYCAREREHWIERVSNADGVVDERELTPGFWRLMFAPTYCEPQSQRVELREGLNDLGTLTFARVTESGSVCVRTREHEPLLTGVLWLRSVDSLAVDRWNYLVGGGRSRLEPGDPLSFCFQHLPAGEYEVRLFADDPYGVRVDTQRVSVPGSEVVFERVAAPRVALFVDVRVPSHIPAPKRSAVLSFHRRTRSFQLHQAHVGSPLAHVEFCDERRWFAVASGCQPREFQVDVVGARNERLELVVTLNAGFGALIATRDGDVLTRTPGVGHESQLRRQRADMLAGVHIHADGASLLDTDADGLGLLNAAIAPERLEATGLARCQVDVVNFSGGALRDPLAPIEFWLASMEY